MIPALLILALIYSAPVHAQIDFRFGPGGVWVDPDEHEHRHHHHWCRELREHCIHKYELGEEGEGNCRRYREECGD